MVHFFLCGNAYDQIVHCRGAGAGLFILCWLTEWKWVALYKVKAPVFADIRGAPVFSISFLCTFHYFETVE
ncbi:MAG: hypothetical protein GX887_03365 [Firmicutes bacterium]|nr:hypothetical protein [Bacillota bacterium]